MLDFDKIGIGVDIEEIKRFEKYQAKDNPFVLRLYTKNEIDYCFKNKNFASHLAARYCAKEACLKALGSLGYDAVSYADFEVFNLANGVPTINILNGRLKDRFDIKISISHNKTNTICYAMAYKKDVSLDFLDEKNENELNKMPNYDNSI